MLSMQIANNTAHKIQEKYHIKSKIGNGNFSVVYLATNRLNPNQIVAIKIMNTHLKIGIKEANLLKKLSHPNIIQIYDFQNNPTQNQLKIVMEYIPQNILQLYESHKFGLRQEQVKCILFQCAMGLSHIHQRNIIHRDIKPENLLIDKKKAQIKIIDFGLAAFSYKINTDYVATRWYRAPQNLLATKQYTTSIDIFSLGCVVVQLYLGDPLFPGLDNIDQICKIFNILGEPTAQNWPKGYQMYLKLGLKSKCQSQNKISLKKLLESCSKDLLQIIQQMLTLNPKKRITAIDILKHKYFSDIKTIVPTQVYNKFQQEILRINKSDRKQRVRFLSQQKANYFSSKNNFQAKHIKSHKNLLVEQKIVNLKNRIQTVLQNLHLGQKKKIELQTSKEQKQKSIEHKNQNIQQTAHSLKKLYKPKEETIRTIQKINYDLSNKASNVTLKKSIQKYQINMKKLNQKMESIKFPNNSKQISKSNVLQEQNEIQKQLKKQTKLSQTQYQKVSINQNKFYQPSLEMLSFRGIQPIKKNKLSIKDLGKKTQIRQSFEGRNQSIRSQSQSSNSLQKNINNINENRRTSNFNSHSQLNNSREKIKLFYISPKKQIQSSNVAEQRKVIENNKQKSSFIDSSKQEKIQISNKRIHQSSNFAKAKVTKNYTQINPNTFNMIAQLSQIQTYKIQNQNKGRSFSTQRKEIYGLSPQIHRVFQNNQVLNQNLNRNHQINSSNDSFRKNSVSNNKNQTIFLQQMRNTKNLQQSQFHRQNKAISLKQGNLIQSNLFSPFSNYENNKFIKQSSPIISNQSISSHRTSIHQINNNFGNNSGFQQCQQPNHQNNVQPYQYKKDEQSTSNNLKSTNIVSNNFNNNQSVHNRSIQNKIKLVASRDFQKGLPQHYQPQYQTSLAYSMPLNVQRAGYGFQNSGQISKQEEQKVLNKNILVPQNIQKKQNKQFFLSNNKNNQNKKLIEDQQQLYFTKNKISLKSSLQQTGLSKIKSLANLPNLQQKKQIYKYVQIKQRPENKNILKGSSIYQKQSNFQDQIANIVNYNSRNSNLNCQNSNMNFSNNPIEKGFQFSNIPITHSTKSFKSVVHREFYVRKPLPPYDHNTRFSFDGNQKITLNSSNKIRKDDLNYQESYKGINNFNFKEHLDQDKQQQNRYRNTISLNNLRQTIKDFKPQIIYKQQVNKQQQASQEKTKKTKQNFHKDLKQDEKNSKQENQQAHIKYQDFKDEQNYSLNGNLSNNKSQKNININLNLKIYNNKKK